MFVKNFKHFFFGYFPIFEVSSIVDLVDCLEICTSGVLEGISILTEWFCTKPKI